jgi:prepilin-type N-terminal cleavage/methylation domain-containing protein/prepilin-type processing-associated H-X9-DG protein
MRATTVEVHVQVDADCRSSRCARAFTLVELLVVIAIIAVLVGILLPAVSRAREQANTAICLSNLRMIGLSVRMYANDFRNYPPPVRTDSGSYWYNVMVDRRYMSVPNGTGKGPQTRSVLFCPSSNSAEFISQNLDTVGNIPASRTDERGAMSYRVTSAETGVSIDCWYGMNADESSATTGGFPGRCMEVGMNMIRLNQITRASEMVLFYDGVYWHLGGVNANRLNARHAFRKKTNLAFCDGHAQTYNTATLPGGLGVAQTSDFSVANLRLHRKGGDPLWQLDQQ